MAGLPFVVQIRSGGLQCSQTNMAGKEIERGKDTLGNLYWFDPKQIGLEFGYNY
jgi:hypothetical protein